MGREAPLKDKERGMRVTRNSWWLYLTTPIVGFDEGEGEGSSGGEGASGEGTGEGAGEGAGSSGTGESGEGAGDDTAGLKSALQKERTDRKAMEKELKALRKAEEERANKEKTEIQRATDDATKNADKVTKLAAGFKRNALNSAILEAAGKAKFRDPSDALRPEVIDAIGVEQDEDDPSQVTIDSATVTKAINQLAKSKPHYIAPEQRQTTPKSGSQFGGSGTQTKQTAEQQALVNRYPALRSRINS